MLPGPADRQRVPVPKLKEIIPTFGVNLIEDAKACDRIRTETAPVLKVENL